MTEKRNNENEDKLIAGLFSQGARIEVKGPLLWEPPTTTMEWPGPRIILEDCDLVTTVSMESDPNSDRVVIFDGNDVTFSHKGRIRATGKLEPRPVWCDMLLSDGTTRVCDAWTTNIPTECYISIGGGCFAYDSGKACGYCGFGKAFSQGVQASSINQAVRPQDHAIEGIAVAAQNGWRGTILLVGGLLPPDQRGRHFTDTVEAKMTRFRELLNDEDILSELHIAVDNYPPDDLGEFHKWKSFGVNAIAIDTEVLNPDWFKAICPAKDKQRWDEAQEAAAEVFGRGRGSSNLFVCGIEPMAGMLEGYEERLSKGVYPIPMPYGPHPDSPMAGMGSPSAEWFQEAFEKIVDIRLKYADTFDVDLTEDDRWGYTWRSKSFVLLARMMALQWWIR